MKTKQVSIKDKVKTDIDTVLAKGKGFYSTKSFGSWNLFKKAKGLENADFRDIMKSFQAYLGKDIIIYSNRRGVYFAYAKHIDKFSQYMVTTMYQLKDSQKRTPQAKESTAKVEYIL